jgi:predicted nucleic acid-binding protein
VTLTDTGPLVAIINADDPNQVAVSALVNTIRSWPLATTEACLTEALYLIGKTAGTDGQEALWRFVEIGSLVIFTPSPRSPHRSREFMARYQDLPCDYADATLLVAAEDHGLRQVFTLDGHFYAYRLTNGMALEVIS